MVKNNRIYKKSWSKPELLVLVRSNPEETVLASCKTPSTPVSITQKPTCSANACKTNTSS